MGNCQSLELTAYGYLNDYALPPFANMIENPNNNIDFFKIVDYSNPQQKFDLILSVLCIRSVSTQDRIALLAKIKARLDADVNQSKKPEINGSYIESTALLHPDEINLFNYVLDNFFYECDDNEGLRSGDLSDSSSSTSVRLLCVLAAQPQSIEMLRAFISSGKMSPRARNDNHTTDDDQNNPIQAQTMRKLFTPTTRKLFTPKMRKLFTPKKPRTALEIACKNLNVDAAREFSVAGIGGANYADCVSTLVSIHGENFGTDFDERATNIFLSLVPQPHFNKDKILKCSEGGYHKLNFLVQNFITKFGCFTMPGISDAHGLVLSARCGGLPQLAACLLSNGAPDVPPHSVRSKVLEDACNLTGAFSGWPAGNTSEEHYYKTRRILEEVFSDVYRPYSWMIDLNAKDENGRTLVQAAKRSGAANANSGVVEILVANGAHA